MLLLIVGGCGTTKPQREAELPPGQDREGHFEKTVFYATDRTPKAENPLHFVGQFDPAPLKYGDLGVSVPDGHQLGDMRSDAWSHLGGRDDTTEFVTIVGRHGFVGRGELRDSVVRLLSVAESDDVLVFVPGFGVSFDEAAKQTAQLAYDLRFSGVSILYSWSAGSSLTTYLAAKHNAKSTVANFQDFLKLVMTELGARKVHVIAHSMGTQPLMEVLVALDPANFPDGYGELHNVVLVAPDIGIELFKGLALRFNGKARRITIYSSDLDRAIGISERLHGRKRLGGMVVVGTGFDTIDAREVSTGFATHSYHGDSILEDLRQLVLDDLGPQQRFGLRRVEDETAGGTYWRIPRKP